MKMGEQFWALDAAAQESDYHDNFFKVEIIGETVQSWIMGRPGSELAVFRVSKKDPLMDKNLHVWLYTDETKDDACWIHNHRPRMLELLGNIRNVAKLLVVADAMGYCWEDWK